MPSPTTATSDNFFSNLILSICLCLISVSNSVFNALNAAALYFGFMAKQTECSLNAIEIRIILMLSFAKEEKIRPMVPFKLTRPAP